MRSNQVYYIIYVVDQDRSAAFYEQLLETSPRLHVPGMTEFELRDGVVLGLMPVTGIARLLGVTVAGAGGDAVRGEIYLVVDEPGAAHARALSLGARELSALSLHDWGHEVAYSVDPDGYILAFARVATAQPS